MKTATAIITARGGSKGVPRKNVRSVEGIPLIGYSIAAALESPLVDECYVTTEDAEIKQISLQLGAKVIDRPEQYALDSSLSQEAVAHALEKIEENGSLPEFFVLLQPTSPMRTSQHLTQCLESFFSSGCACGVSVTEAEHHPWKMLFAENNQLRPVHTKESLESPRQQLPPAYRVNGAIYVMSSRLFLEHRRFFVDPAHPFEMNHEDSLDVDTESDLQMFEDILRRKKLKDG